MRHGRKKTLPRKSGQNSDSAFGGAATPIGRRVGDTALGHSLNFSVTLIQDAL